MVLLHLPVRDGFILPLETHSNIWRRCKCSSSEHQCDTFRLGDRSNGMGRGDIFVLLHALTDFLCTLGDDRDCYYSPSMGRMFATPKPWLLWTRLALSNDIKVQVDLENVLSLSGERKRDEKDDAEIIADDVVHLGLLLTKMATKKRIPFPFNAKSNGHSFPIWNTFSGDLRKVRWTVGGGQLVGEDCKGFALASCRRIHYASEDCSDSWRRAEASDRYHLLAISNLVGGHLYLLEQFWKTTAKVIFGTTMLEHGGNRTTRTSFTHVGKAHVETIFISKNPCRRRSDLSEGAHMSHVGGITFLTSGRGGFQFFPCRRSLTRDGVGRNPPVGDGPTNSCQRTLPLTAGWQIYMEDVGGTLCAIGGNLLEVAANCSKIFMV
eukprot:Gb_00564 [translate_table: standard]